MGDLVYYDNNAPDGGVVAISQRSMLTVIYSIPIISAAPPISAIIPLLLTVPVTDAGALLKSLYHTKETHNGNFSVHICNFHFNLRYPQSFSYLYVKRGESTPFCGVFRIHKTSRHSCGLTFSRIGAIIIIVTETRFCCVSQKNTRHCMPCRSKERLL